jgi:hypothetical protein
VNYFILNNSYKNNCQISWLNFTKESAKQLVTTEKQRRISNPKQRRVSNPHISHELRGSIQKVLGVKEPYPHTAEDKLQTRKTCGLCDWENKRKKTAYVHHLCKKLVSEHKDLSHMCFTEYVRYLRTASTKKTKLLFFHIHTSQLRQFC